MNKLEDEYIITNIYDYISKKEESWDIQNRKILKDIRENYINKIENKIQKSTININKLYL